MFIEMKASKMPFTEFIIYSTQSLNHLFVKFTVIYLKILHVPSLLCTKNKF